MKLPDGPSLVISALGRVCGAWLSAKASPLSKELTLDANLGVEDGGGHEVTLLHVLHVLQDTAGSIAGH